MNRRDFVKMFALSAAATAVCVAAPSIMAEVPVGCCDVCGDRVFTLGAGYVVMRRGQALCPLHGNAVIGWHLECRGAKEFCEPGMRMRIWQVKADLQKPQAWRPVFSSAIAEQLRKTLEETVYINAPAMELAGIPGDRKWVIEYRDDFKYALAGA